MSHPLHASEVAMPGPLSRPWAATQVRLERGALVLVENGAFIAAADTMWVELPESIPVLDPDGRRVQPSPGRRFFISIETFSPFHAVTEAECIPLPRIG